MDLIETRLADDRELIYFYDKTAPEAGVPADRRVLPEVATATELRYDALRGEWVAIAAHRQGRTHLPSDDQCPLCPSTPQRRTEIPAPAYDVAVFENRFPSLALDVPEPPPGSEHRAGRGRCEVVCFTSDHDSSFGKLTPERARTVVDAWAHRTEALSQLPDVEHVYVFENRGIEIGVTLSHPHGQIYALPFVPPRVRRTLDVVRAHREATGGDLFADRLAAEVLAQVRVVARTRHWTAFVPIAARWPFEIHLYPNRRVADLVGLDDAERDDLARVYLDVLRMLDGVYGVPMPYIAAWHQAPVRGADRELAWLHLELFSSRRAPEKLKYLAGTESGMDVFINDIAPERAAEMLRAAGAGPEGTR
ncbi:galactose-1-phosphate uridylyltransferase [Yinghuangia seranimata]|uniref:galactose-1-phosphate uridylyltransferase n=1 Tax=Yinghuangia seranimata TaxID=408067 RepID=UPI00248BF333|nr:galactose-1-phosphate uridylyltransferase [Yinghuangia seranimata]MDI2125845.1 galactose-1-phosphate uridylyltransferase [Yinghuangia seranimata]